MARVGKEGRQGEERGRREKVRIRIEEEKRRREQARR
jgi:hypothetical protein